MYTYRLSSRIINDLFCSTYMRGKGIILLLLVVLAVSAYSQFASAGSKSVETAVVPTNPVSVTCHVSGGHTQILVSAADDVDHVVATVGSDSPELADHLQKGWSVSRSISGTYQSAVIRFVWRGAEKQIPVVCQ